MKKRIDYTTIAADSLQHLRNLGKSFHLIDPKLRALVELRCSQINRCSFCCDMHAREARQRGEDPQRLDVLCAWRETDFFTDAERAALAWAETITCIATDRAPENLYANLRPHFDEAETVELTLIITTINSWNRLAIAMHSCPDRRH